MDPQSLEAARGTFSAVVAVHLFGQLADMPALLAAAGNAPVIEDAAHAPLSYLNGRMAGRFGVASFYSFASTKYWPAGGGGLAVVHHANLARKLADTIRLAFPAFARPGIAQPASSGGKGSRLQPAALRDLRKTNAPLGGEVGTAGALPGSEGDPALVRRGGVPPGIAVSRESANCSAPTACGSWHGSATVEDVVLPRERPGAQYNYHLFPVLLRDREERTAVMAAMWAKFVDTSMIYSDVVKECRRFGYRGGCPVAESVADRLITLPNHAALTGQDIDHVAQVFLSSLQACRDAQPSARGLAMRAADGIRRFTTSDDRWT